MFRFLIVPALLVAAVLGLGFYLGWRGRLPARHGERLDSRWFLGALSSEGDASPYRLRGTHCRIASDLFRKSNDECPKLRVLSIRPLI
jgi:hypothetical protein